MNMIETVAKAIYEEDDAWSAAFPWPSMPSSDQSADNYRRIARAAIEAMNIPTQAMCRATGDGPNHSARIYTAMISKALEGGE